MVAFFYLSAFAFFTAIIGGVAWLVDLFIW